MLRNRTGSLVVLSMLLALVGCPHKPAPPPPPVTIIALVTPICDSVNGCGVEQLAQPGQILEWRTMYTTPNDFWVVFSANANPCEPIPPSTAPPAFLHGTPDNPAQCTVAAQSTPYIKYSYVIVNKNPKDHPQVNFNTTPCGGCSYLGGSASSSAVRGPAAAPPTPAEANPAGSSATPAVAPSNAAPAVASPKGAANDNPGEIDLACVSGSAITIDPPKKTANQGVYWQLNNTQAFDWQVQLDAPGTGQKPLCGTQTTFTPDSPFCTFAMDVSGDYYYTVTSPSGACSSSKGTITLPSATMKKNH